MSKEPLLFGQIDLLLLAVLARGPAHGYAVIEELRVRSRGAIDLPEGTVYPALYRLEKNGLVTSTQSTIGGRARRTYHLTRVGQEALSERRESWRGLVKSVNAVLQGG